MKQRGRFPGRGMLAITAAALSLDFDCPDGTNGLFKAVDGVAVVSIEGPLTQKPTWFWDNYESIQARCAAAFADAGTRAIMLEINSPGGDVAGCFELAAELRALATKSGKRFVAFTDGMAASAAYALASATDEIYVTSTAQVGSIGVINALVDVTALDRAQGIRISVISSGERKKDGNPHVAITDEAEDVLRSNVNALAGIFFDWVASRRPALSAAALQSFDGALFFGTNAEKVGLANGVTTKTELLASLARAPSASAAGTSEATMADEKDDKKSYEDEMRSKLEEDSKSDDEKKAATAKKMLKALDGDGDGDEKSDDEKKAEDEKKEADAKAKAEEDEKKKDGEAKASASVLDRLGKVERENAELRARNEAGERASMIATRSDLTEGQRSYLASLPLAQMKSALAAFPPPPPDPAAIAKIAPTMGASNGKDRTPRLPPKESEDLRERMNLSSPKVAIRREGASLVFPAMTPDQAKSAQAREGGA